MSEQQRGQRLVQGAVRPPIVPAVPATPPPPSGIPSTPPWPPGSRAPQTPAEAAQLIADAFNAARAAGFYLWRDDGHIMCEHAGIYEDHEGAWRLLD